jgi:hypothetical protein
MVMSRPLFGWMCFDAITVRKWRLTSNERVWPRMAGIQEDAMQHHTPGFA